jgi:hypothetical protein
MRNLIVSVLTLAVVLVLSTTLYARDVMIGLSPFHADKAEAKAQVKTVIQFLLDTVEPGEQAIIFDAFHVQTLGVFAVPEKSSYRNPKAKLRINKVVVKKLLAFADQAMIPSGDSRPSVSEALRLPHFLIFLGENHASSQNTDVLILGSPLVDDPNARGFSMAQGHIPGDGHLQFSRRDTPYGIQGQETLLSNFRIHLAIPQGSQRDDHHAFAVKRFWVLWVQQQGGSVATFSRDLLTVLQRIKTQAPAPSYPFHLEKIDSPKLEMILLRPPNVKHHTSLYERPLSKTPVSPDYLHSLNNLEVGITWRCDACDLDLYARPGPGTEILSYQHTQSPEGTYWKDWTHSPSQTNGYEIVSFTGAVDAKALFLAVNFYGGKVPEGVRGEVRISVNGETYAKDFVIHARHGNLGKGREKTLVAHIPANQQWIVIDPLQVLGLREEG